MSNIYIQPIVDGSAFEAKEYVVSMLKKIGNLESLEVHFEEMYNNPITVNGETYCYTCILTNDKDDEFYLNTNCGYGGTGPSCTEEILKLLGFREECGILKEKLVRRENINLIHDLNVLFISNKSVPQEEQKQRFMLELKPHNAYTRYKIREILNVMGNLMNYKSAAIDDRLIYNYPAKYCNSRLDQDELNEVLFLDRSYDLLTNEQIRNIIECILHRMLGDNIEYNIECN